MLRLTSVAGRFRSLVPAASSFRPDWLDASLGLEARSLTTSQAAEQESKADKERESFSSRAPWLRAAVLGASDGLVTTSSLLAGVGAAAVDHRTLMLTGVAGVVAGAASMAVGEYVSVSSQRDAERADLVALERQLQAGAASKAEAERDLAQVHIDRGLPPKLAGQVASTLTNQVEDPAAAHARDRDGVDADNLTSPSQAAAVSLLAFSLGGAAPLATAALLTHDAGLRSASIAVVSLLALAGMGALSAHLGGAPIGKATARVVLGGCLAIGLTHLVGTYFGVDTT
ncbi:hypothetical protein ACKKBF_B38700 [Auxenochlorella protothecoides x Auxenochlorella symbiontica]